MNLRLLPSLTLAAAVFAAGVPLPAQSQTAPPTPSFAQQGSTGYSVTGRMICGDTQRAARFAQVTLIAANQDGGFGGGRRLSARTDLDGNFTVVNVPAGDFYVAGSLPGYVNQAQLVQSVLNAGTDPGTALAGVPLVHVSAGGGSTLLSLQRGGVIAGTVQWDDGTPAAGVGVGAQPVPPNSTTAGTTSTQNISGRGLGAGFAGTQTDDRGRFRLSGLAPGSYYLRASVQAPAPQRSDEHGQPRTISLAVYAPDKVRRTDATPINIGSGEERADLNVVLGLAGMHAVSGTVSSSSATVRSGSVSLTDQTDNSLNRTGTINSDGSFVVPYVPPGTYTMRITASSQLQTYGRGGDGSSTDASARFQPMQESITVTDSDLSGLSVSVTTATASQ